MKKRKKITLKEKLRRLNQSRSDSGIDIGAEVEKHKILFEHRRNGKGFAINTEEIRGEENE